MANPDIVPEKLTNPFDYRILAAIAVAVVSFHLYVNYVAEPADSDVIISIFSFINPLAVAIAGFVVFSRYKDAAVFGRSYLALSVGYFMIFLGEITYLLYDLFLNIDPYPSIADVFFFAQYPLLLVHLILNIRFFYPEFSRRAKAWIVALPASILFVYFVSSFVEAGQLVSNFDFYYGIIFVTASSATLAFAILGSSIFKEGVLGKAWLLLVFGIMFNTAGDTWYYLLETYDQYSLTHPVNLLWYAGYWVVVYALYKHKKAI